MEITFLLKNGQEIINNINSKKELQNIYNKIIQGKAILIGNSIYQGWDIIDAKINLKNNK